MYLVLFVSAMSKVFENTAMFGDLILRLPDITHDIYDRNKQWEFLIGWSVWFCMESGVFQGPHERLLKLVSTCCQNKHSMI